MPLKPPRPVVAVVAGGVALASALVAELAHAAEPDVGAQMQLRRGFEYCDEGNAAKYLSQRDFAFKADPTLKAWTGKVGKYPVRESLARCDGPMTAKAADDARVEAARDAYRPVEAACLGRRRDEFLRLKTDWLAKHGAQPVPLRDGKQAKDEIARCDERLAKDASDQAKRDAEIAAKKAQWEAERVAGQKKAAEEQAKLEAKRARVMGKLKGDKLALAKAKGLPDSVDWDKLPAASTWEYVEYREGYHEDQQLRCSTFYKFSGNKKVGTKQQGIGCQF